MRQLSSKVEGQDFEIASKQAELDKASDDLLAYEQAASSVKRDARINLSATIAMQEQMRRSKLQIEQLELELKETRDKLAYSQSTKNKLEVVCTGLKVGEDPALTRLFLSAAFNLLCR